MIRVTAEPMAFPTPMVAEVARATPARGRLAYAAAKRALDVAVALTLLVLLLPLLALVSLAIVLDSPGRVFYRGERVGRFGERFTVLKFRSMCANADARTHAQFVRSLLHDASACTVYKVPNDGRITRVGAVLRRTSLDELPQLWNVLRGEMSLVGPRPDVPYAAAEYEPWMRQRLDVKPGITGLWQVSGRSRLSLLDMYRLDSAYAEDASLLLDLRILVRTVPAVLRADGAA